MRMGAVDLYWIPLGAGGRSVAFNGRVFEALAAAARRRPRCDLYHAALVVSLDGERYAIEIAPSPDGDLPGRGVVATGAVGSRWAGRLRLFRYEVRCWRGGSIPDLAYAVGGPRRLGSDPELARRVIDARRHGPDAGLGPRRAACGRDVELQLDDRVGARESGRGDGRAAAAAGRAGAGLGRGPGGSVSRA